MLPVPAGCEQCRNRGYHRRIGIFEIALPNRQIRDAIENAAAEDELRDLLRSNATQSLVTDGLLKVIDGATSLDEVRAMTWVPLPA